MLGKGSATDTEIFELFDSLDLDGSGMMDIKEVGEALKALQNSAAEADQEIAQLKKVTAELWKTAKAAQVELRKVQKLDEAEATEIKAQIEEDRRARLEVERQAALKKAEARAMIMQAEVAKKKEFEEKIKARREAQKAILDAELKAFARAQSESETKTDTADGVG
jgi:Ca2+-binding EF-hand superfamily protein